MLWNVIWRWCCTNFVMEILHCVMAKIKVPNATFKGLKMENVHINESNRIYGDPICQRLIINAPIFSIGLTTNLPHVCHQLSQKQFSLRVMSWKTQLISFVTSNYNQRPNRSWSKLYHTCIGERKKIILCPPPSFLLCQRQYFYILFTYS